MTKITVDRVLFEQAIAGAIFDFAGYLTSHPDTIEVGSVANAAVMVERIRAWAGYSGLSIENANVEKWNATLAEPVVAPVAYRSLLASGSYAYSNTADFFANAEPLFTSPPPPAAPARTSQDVCTVPLLRDDEVAQCIKDASKGSAINRDGSTSQRIVRSAEQLVRRKAGL